MSRLGLTIPLEGLPLKSHAKLLDGVADAGYTDLWSMEVSSADAFTPLAAAAVSHPQFRLGTAIVPAYTRSPALMAMSIASLADLATSEVLVGIGASSNVIIEKWNGVEFTRPYQRVRDVVTFVRRALTGERVDMACESFTIDGFRLSRIPERQPKLLIAALRPGMLRLAGNIGDGAILNWLSAADVKTVVPYVQEGGGDPEIVARLFVIASEDSDAVRAAAKRNIAAYLNVPVYAEFHRWLGRGAMLEEMWRAWSSGDRKAALAAIPDALVDELFIYGSPSEIAARIQEYVDAGVTTPMLSVTPLEGEAADHITTIGAEVAAGW